jgi:hypothetical protein
VTRPAPTALGAAVVLGGVMAAHAVLETARDALFLTRLGADRLAWAYLAIAAAAVVAVGVLRRCAGPRDPRRVLIGLVAVAAAGTTGLALTIALAPSIVFVLYVWTGLVAALVVPAFWIVVDRSLRITDAKRVFAGIAAGGSVGALAGSALAAGLTRVVAACHLVTAAAVVLAAVAAAAVRYAPRPSDEHRAPPRRRIETAVEAARPRRYGRLLAGLGLAATVALTLGDLLFKTLVADRLPGADLATAFGAINTAINVVGLVIQLAVTPRLLARLGVGGALTVLPVIFLATALGFVVTGAALAIVALKAGDAGLRHSVHRVASEILFLPLPAPVRDATKPLIDVIGQRGGQALAAIAAVGAVGAGAGATGLGALTAIAAAGWLVLVRVTRTAYVEQFRDTLAAGDLHRDVRVPALDADSVALLTEALASPDEAEAVAALDLLARRGGRIPALVLYHPNHVVVGRALALLDGAGRIDVERALSHLLDHDAPAIRAAALAAASRHQFHRDRLIAALADRDTDVRAAALVGLSLHSALAGDADPARVAAGIAALVHGDVGDQLAIARAIGRAPAARFAGVLDYLVDTREPAVVRAVMQIYARAPELVDVATLIRLLDDPHVRGDVRRVLAAAGHGHLEHLIAALDDAATPIAVRRHLPRTISQFASRRAAQALVGRLLREPDGTTEFKILRALGRIRADRPELRFDLAPVRDYARRAVGDVVRYAGFAARLRSVRPAPAETLAGPLLAELLAEKQRQTMERVFRALGILHPRSELRSVHDSLLGGDDDRRAAAREILEHLLTAELRPLLGVLDGAPAGADAYPTDAALLAAMIADQSDSLRCIAAYHATERTHA